MSERKGSLYVVVSLVALLGVLLSLIVGCFGGAVAGFLTGRWQGRVIARQVAESMAQGPTRPLPQRIPTPEIPLEEWPVVSGALIQWVEPEGPADEAGLKEGDIITAVDGQPVDRSHPLDQRIRRYDPGDRVEITYWRGDRERTVQVRLGEHPDEEGIAYLGIRFVPLYNMWRRLEEPTR